MSEDFRETFVELGDAVIARKPHVQPIDMLRQAVAAEAAGIQHEFSGEVLLDLDLDEPVIVLESTWAVRDGEAFRATWGLVRLAGRDAPYAVHWHSPADAHDAAVFEMDTVAITSTVDLAGLVAALEQAAFDDLLI